MFPFDDVIMVPQSDVCFALFSQSHWFCIENSPCLDTDPKQRGNYLGNGMEVVTNLTQWGLNKMDDILQTTFSAAFSWMAIIIFWLRFHWILFLRVHLTIFNRHYWFSWWLGAGWVICYRLNQYWPRCLTQSSVKSQGINELTPWLQTCMIAMCWHEIE